MSAATKSTMTKEHKEALAQGRREGAAVRRYLEALVATRGKRGRKRTPASVEKRIAAINAELDTTGALDALLLRQERKNLEDELKRLQSNLDIKKLEKDFVASAKAYGERKGIDYSTWREAGVQPAVLTKAGIKRTRRS